MRFDKWTFVIGAGAIVLTIVLGAQAGARAGVFTALSGAAFVTLWQLASERYSKLQAARSVLRDAAARMALPHLATISPAGFLRPEEEIVQFEPRPEFDVLSSWLASAELVGVQLVTGEAGAGKTRLAIHLANRAAEFGYHCYWVHDGAEQEAADAAGRETAPVLLLVDYAETRTNLAVVLAQLFSNDPGPARRVLLLARSAGEWWQQLIAEADARTSDALAAVTPVALGSLTGSKELFERALTAFAAKLETEPPDVPMPALGPAVVVLVVHAAALLAVLDHLARLAGGADERVISSGDVIKGLLGHEARYWQRTQARYQLALSPAVRDRAVAAGTLVGAEDEPAAVRLLGAIDDLADPGIRGKSARWLHDLYPTATSSPASGEWIGRLRPDLIAEHHVVTVLAGQPDLTRAIFTGLDEHRALRALTTLGRAALTQASALDLIQLAVNAHPSTLIVPAMTAAVETNASIADIIVSVLTSNTCQPNLLARITQALPEFSTTLAEIAALTYELLADAAVDNGQRAACLVDLSTWLSRVGRLEDALAAADEATTICRELAISNPEAFLPQLARALNNRAACSADLGSREDALTAIGQAVVTYRDLATSHPQAFLPDLAMALSNLSLSLAGLGRREDAVSVATEAVTIRRELAAADPEAFLPDLAVGLNNQSISLAGLGRREEALAAINEAVDAYRTLSAARPDRFLPNLAASLNSQSNRLGELGHREEALVAINEAVDAYRALSAAFPDRFLANLAGSLNNQSGCLADVGRREDALAAINEAVSIRRILADALPDKFLPDLGSSLNNQSNQLANLGSRQEALAAINEAVEIYRTWSAAHADVFLPDLATALNNQSLRFASLGRHENALSAINEAVAIRRQLASTVPAVFTLPLKWSLTTQASVLESLGLLGEADAARSEAAQLS